MRELTKNEIQCIAGGYFDLHKANFPKPSVAMKVADGAVKTIPAARWGAVAFEVGYEAGKLLNKHTPVQDWIGKGVDKLTGLDKVGINNNNNNGNSNGNGNGNGNSDRDNFGGRN